MIPARRLLLKRILETATLSTPNRKHGKVLGVSTIGSASDFAICISVLLTRTVLLVLQNGWVSTTTSPSTNCRSVWWRPWRCRFRRTGRRNRTPSPCSWWSCPNCGPWARSMQSTSSGSGPTGHGSGCHPSSQRFSTYPSTRTSKDSSNNSVRKTHTFPQSF